MLLYFFILTQLFFSQKTPLNFHHGTLEELQTFKNDQKYVFIIQDCKGSFLQQLQKLAMQFQQENIVHFYQTEKQKPNCVLKLSIYNHNKTYHGIQSISEVQDWILQILNEKVLTQQNLNEDHKNHQMTSFLFIRQEWYKKNDFYFDVLSKLVYPVLTIAGDDKFLNQYLKIKIDSNHPLILKQAFTNKLIAIKTDQKIEQIAQYILKNEIPKYVELDSNFRKTFLDLQIPTLFIYLDQDIKNQLIKEKFIDEINLEFVVVFVTDFSQIRDKKFYQQFLDISQKNSGVLVTFEDGFNRYYLEGNLTPNIIKNFTLNYTQDNLRPHRLNQKIKRKDKKNKINAKKLHKILKQKDKLSIIFAHTQKIENYSKILKYFKKFIKYFKKKAQIDFYTIDKMKNDLDGNYYEQDIFCIIKNFHDSVKAVKIQSKSYDIFQAQMLSLLPTLVDYK